MSTTCRWSSSAAEADIGAPREVFSAGGAFCSFTREGTGLETRQISYMLAIAETGSVTKAAEGLFIAQSALDLSLIHI